MYIKIIFLFITMLMLFVSAVSQQREIVYDENAELLFNTGVTVYEKGDYRDALAYFNRVLEIREVTQRTTAAYLMSAKAMIELGRYMDAIRRLQLFIDRFPTSLYVADAYFTTGIAYQRDQRYEDALYNFVECVVYSTDKALMQNAELFISNITNQHITVDELERLYSDARGNLAPGYYARSLAEIYILEGNIRGARRILERVIRRNPDHPIVNELNLLLDNIERGIALKIGVILPLFEDEPRYPIRNVGMEMLQGIRQAIDEHNEESSIKIYLEIRDSRRQPSLAARHVQELVRDSEIVAIIGPVFSDETFATAGVANARGVPLITPTATANHIAAIGNYIFQTNPDYNTRGRIMARYAVEQLGMRNLAVLAPIDSHGREIAEGFMEEVERIDEAFIAVNEWYKSGETQLKEQYRNIRIRGFQDSLHLYVSFSQILEKDDILKLVAYGFEPVYIDSLIENEHSLAVTDIFGEDGARIADSLGIQVIYGDFLADSLDIPVKSLDAIFVPITDHNEIGIISAQLAYYNIHAVILGTGEWNNIMILEENRRYVDGMIFASDTYWDTDDPDYVQFFNNITANRGTRPTRNSLKGYDSTKLLLNIIKGGATTRTQIARTFSANTFYRGIHSPIFMGSSRVNTAKNILRYSDGDIKKIDELILY